MLTAVQLRNDRSIKCALLYGQPESIRSGSLGKIALFADNKVVIYCLSAGSKKRAFLFKTGPCGKVSLPGVEPLVSLLCDAKSKGKVSRLMRAVTVLKRRNLQLRSVPEGFYLRLNVILGNKNFAMRDVEEVLSHAKI